MRLRGRQAFFMSNDRALSLMSRPDDVATASRLTSLKRTHEGWEQTLSWAHAELWDEGVPELDSDGEEAPLLPSPNPEVAVRTYLLLGDPNAGKSTLLHSLVHSGAREWAGLQAELPLLSASFRNLALTEGDRPPIDQGAFLDSDLARTSFMIVAEDWRFWLEERGLRDEGLVGQRFVMVQLLEVPLPSLPLLSSLPPLPLSLPLGGW